MIYITGDTHGRFDRFSDENMPGQSGWTADDILIVTGDFGYVMYGERYSLAEKNNLNALAKKPYTICFADGNHEGFPALAEYPVEQRWGGTVSRLRDNIFWLHRGEIFTIQGNRFYVMGGARSTDREERDKLGLPWFPQEIPGKAELEFGMYRLEQQDMTVDYVISHTAPYHAIREFFGRVPHPEEQGLCWHLQKVYDGVTFRKWFFGHLHLNQHPDLGFPEDLVPCFTDIHPIEPK